jgi:hypothetical protein
MRYLEGQSIHHNTSFAIFNTFMFNEIFGRGSLKDYYPISIVKEEADWEYTSGVLAQEVYSLYVNNTLELNKNTMLIHCIWI